MFTRWMAACGGAVMIVTVSLWALLHGSNSQSPTAGKSKDASQCAQWCVHRCASLFGVPTTIEGIQALIPGGPAGATLHDMKQALASIGLDCTAYRMKIDNLSSDDLPCVAHLRNPDHFVVLARQSARGFLMFDNGSIRRNVAAEDLSERWTGNVLRVQRSQGPLEATSRQQGIRFGPLIQFQTLRLDFDVPQDQKDVVYEFPFFNSGSEPLQILNVAPSCTCLRVERPLEAIPPGGTSAIKLVYRPQVTENADFDYSAVVTTNDAQNRQVSLYAGGFVDLRIVPAQVNLGEVVLGEPRTITFMLPNSAMDAKRVVDAVSTTLLSTKISWKEGTDEQDEELKEQGLRVMKCSSCDPTGKLLQVTLVADDEEPRNFNAAVVVRGEFGGDIDEVRVPLSGRFVAPVRASPSLAQFGEVDADKEYRRSVSLEVTGERPMKVLGVIGQDGITCRMRSTSKAAAPHVEIIGTGRDLIRTSGKDARVRVRMEDTGTEYVVQIPVFAWRRDVE